MSKKHLLIVIAIIAAAIALVSCNNKKSTFSTDHVKKYVEKMKQKETYPEEKTKKALKSIFPKMKLD